jgi:ABC-type sugar transport system ATPase subunit
MANDMPLVRLQNITKTFSGVPALKEVGFEVQAGEIHALVGENGAGKSTLIKILSGVYQPDQGEIFLAGKQVWFGSPHEAQRAGSDAVPRNSIWALMDVAENIFLGRQPSGKFGLLDYRKLFEMTSQLLGSLGMRLDPRLLVEHLSVAQRQMVSIARAISVNAQIIILDEPTAALTGYETELLFAMLHRLKARGLGIIYISHRLEEILAIADRVTVLRDGRHIDTRPLQSITLNEIVSLMVGRQTNDLFRKEKASIGPPVLEVHNLSIRGVLENIRLTLHEGEIVGISGLVGAGRTELARAIFGADRITSGEIVLRGQPIRLRNTSDAIRAGIALAPEERKGQGLIVDLPVGENIALASLTRLFPRGFVRPRKQAALGRQYVEKLDIRLRSLQQRVKYLSGGNQQRVVLSKWLATAPKVLILDEPTRGVDVAAKADIHGLMCQLAKQGVAILMISSDLPEILAMSDRILVMHRGRVAGEFERDSATEAAIMACATGEVVQ